MRFLLIPAILACTIPLAAQSKGGAGDLMVMPTRVILEGRERSAEVALRNSGQTACTYRISFKQMHMLPTGQLEEVAKAEGILTAADLVRFTPRQVDLMPGETQTVRIQLRKPEGLKDGEYRSHLVFQGLPPVEPPKPMDEADPNAVSFDIRTVVSLSIPVIVRQGETHAAVALSALTLHPAEKADEPPVLGLTLTRSGDRSVQGEFKVDWQPRSGRAKTVLPLAGVVLYPDIAARDMHLALADAAGLALKDGKLKVTYTYKDIKQPPVVAFLDLP